MVENGKKLFYNIRKKFLDFNISSLVSIQEKTEKEECELISNCK